MITFNINENAIDILLCHKQIINIENNYYSGNLNDEETNKRCTELINKYKIQTTIEENPRISIEKIIEELHNTIKKGGLQ